MSLVISEEFLRTAHISEADLKLEIAILLFQQEKITLGIASQFAGMAQLDFQRILGSRNSTEDFRQNVKSPQAAGLELEQSQQTQAEVLQRIEQQRTFTPALHSLPDTLTLIQEDRDR
jgi:predicted HTH domain antitoxin